MFSIMRIFISLIVLSGFLVSPKAIFAQATDDDIRIDLAPDSEIRLENSFGNVSAQVWSNKYVSVAATIGGAHPGRSPIVIDNRGKLLSISVIRRPIDQLATVDITIKIPATGHLQVVTTSGRITLLGLPAQAALKTSSGSIESTLSGDSDATITARAPNGVIRSTLAKKTDNSSHFLKTQLGNGTRILDLQTETGDIQLTSDNDTSLTGMPETQKPSLLGDSRTSSAAGTPDIQSGSNEVTEGDVIRVDSQLVSMNASVIDRNTNRGLVGLKQSDFRIFEDGREQTILQFTSSAAPFDLILLIDLSGSTREVVQLIRAAALHFIDAARPADRISVITFAGESTLVSPLTADRQLLRERINSIDTARGDTKLYDATDFALNVALKAPSRSRRTAIVLMSDGLDGTIPGVSGQVGSQHSYQDVLKNIQEFDGVLYTLWLNTRYEALNPLDTQPEAFDEGHDRMNEMAVAGGGIFYEVNRLEDLAGSYEHVVADLGTVYSLAYRPSNKVRDGKWRSIRVAVNLSNAVARSKRGYYAN